MSNDVKNVEESFNKFVETMYQYVKEPIKDFAAIKPQLLDIFRTHRPIKVGDYEYGISRSLKRKSQLIIHEFNQRSLVREYFKTGNNKWNCCECSRTSTESNNDGISDVLVLHGIIFVKLEHECAGREILFVQKVQKLYKEKKVEEADALQKSVLGSEDLNIPVKQRKSSSKNMKEMDSKIAAAIQLQYAQQQQIDDQENKPLTADKSHEKLSPEDAFAKIIVNLKEYTNETKEVVMANKSKLLNILKSRRPVKICNYEYGLSENLQINKRLIVFEWNDRRRVREYSCRIDHPNLWRCRECFRQYERKMFTSFCELNLVNGIVFLPDEHICKPADYILVMVYQKFLEDGNKPLARRMRQRVNFDYGESSFTNMVNALDMSLPKTAIEKRKEINNNESNSKTLTNLKRKVASDDLNDNISIDEVPSVRKKSKLNKSDMNDAVIESSAEIEEQNLASIAANSIYHFEKPLISKLEEICDLLNIEYRNKAAKLWDKIIFNQIDTVTPPSSNMKTYYFETENFYQILSIFFTGKSKQHENIKTTIIDAFREKLLLSDEMSTKTFNKRYTDTVTDEHFAFIAKYLSCRILILNGENGNKKYGNWKSTTSSRLTLVVALVDGFYSIVLNF